jgi:hypothetical protein
LVESLRDEPDGEDHLLDGERQRHDLQVLDVEGLERAFDQQQADSDQPPDGQPARYESGAVEEEAVARMNSAPAIRSVLLVFMMSPIVAQASRSQSVRS